MAIYNANGIEISSAYDVHDNALDFAYDVDGNIIFETIPPELIVMSYNVQDYKGINAQQTMQDLIISTYNADIVGIQEFSSTATTPTVGVNMFADYSEVVKSNHKNYMGIASNIPLSNVSSVDYTNQDPEDASRYNETRAYMIGEITVNGKTITLINTHLCFLTQSIKFQQMAELFTLAETKDYVIIFGDFNAYCEEIGDTEYNNLFKPFVDAGYNLANCTPIRGITNTYTGATSATSLADFTSPPDNIITSSNIQIRNVIYDLTKLSYLNGNSIDHIPVIAGLKIT